MVQPLKPEASAGPDPNWFKNHAVGLLTLVVGAVGFLIVALNQVEFWDQPDWRMTVPFLVATVAGGAVSFARKEGLPALPLLGIGLSTAALVLGFVVVFGIVLAATALIIVIMHGVL